jgi:predicted amidophosphoribosyltransferase
MVCLGCHTVASGRLCPACRASMRTAPDRILGDGLRLVAAFQHNGAARTLIHHLKYRGVVGYAEFVAGMLAPRLPRCPLVPVPRAVSRRLKYGVDPALVIANALAHQLSVSVIRAVAPPIHSTRRAGRDHSRPVHPFRLRSALRSPVIIVDDVVTTGATVTAVADAIGQDMVRAVAAANVV